MRLWIDDVRDMPKEYDFHVISSADAISVISSGNITHISFDHDLGEDGTGYDVACYIERGAYEGTIKPITWNIHSANPVGRRNIEQAMKNAEKFWIMGE